MSTLKALGGISWRQSEHSSRDDVAVDLGITRSAVKGQEGTRFVFVGSEIDGTVRSESLVLEELERNDYRRACPRWLMSAGQLGPGAR